MRLARSRVFLAIFAVPALLSAYDTGNAAYRSITPGMASSATHLSFTLSMIYPFLLLLMATTSSRVKRSVRIVLGLLAAVIIICLVYNSLATFMDLTSLVLVFALSLGWLGILLVLTEGMIHVTLRCISIHGDLATRSAMKSWIPWVLGTALSLPLGLLAALCLAARVMGHPLGPTLLAAAAISFVVAVGATARLYARQTVPLRVKGPCS